MKKSPSYAYMLSRPYSSYLSIQIEREDLSYLIYHYVDLINQKVKIPLIDFEERIFQLEDMCLLFGNDKPVIQECSLSIYEIKTIMYELFNQLEDEDEDSFDEHLDNYIMNKLSVLYKLLPEFIKDVLINESLEPVGSVFSY